MENKIKSYILALLTLSATFLFAADFETTKFGAKAGKDGINTAAGQAAISAEKWKQTGTVSPAVTPNDPGLVGADDAQSIQNAVDARLRFARRSCSRCRTQPSTTP